MWAARHRYGGICVGYGCYESIVDVLMCISISWWILRDAYLILKTIPASLLEKRDVRGLGFQYHKARAQWRSTHARVAASCDL